MDNILELVGARIRAIRNSKQLSQQSLAEKAGISYKYLGEIERGQVNASIDVLCKIALAMDVDVSGLLVDVCSRNRLETQERLYALISTLDEKQILLAYDLITALKNHDSM